MGSIFSSPSPTPPTRPATTAYSYSSRPSTYSSYSSRPSTSTYSSTPSASTYSSRPSASTYSSRPSTTSYSSKPSTTTSYSYINDDYPTSYATTRVSEPSYSYTGNSIYTSMRDTSLTSSSHGLPWWDRDIQTTTTTPTPSSSSYSSPYTSTSATPRASYLKSLNASTSATTRVTPAVTRITSATTRVSSSSSQSVDPLDILRSLGSKKQRQNPTTSRSERPICIYWARGNCKNGNACRFRHPTSDESSGSSSSTKPNFKKDQPVCRFWQESRCTRGKACRFLHPEPDNLAVPNPQSNRRSKNTGKGKGKMNPSQSQIKECSICVNDLSSNKFCGLSSQCKHRATICRTCVNEYIRHELDDKGNINIKCPESGCGMQLEYRDVERIASKEVFERYDYICLRQSLQKDPNFRWCKNPECDFGQIHENPDSVTVMTCNKCKARSCFTHDLPIRHGSRCQGCINVRRTEAETDVFMSQETKKCPKCSTRIIKDGGCDHMTCKAPGCQYEFCWMCFADYDQIRKHGNQYHQPGCKWWA